MEPEIKLDISLELAAPLVLLCLMAASYLSAAETAITGVSRPRMHRLAQQGNRRAKLVNATLIGNSVLNIFAASLTTAVLTSLFGSAGVAYATIFVTVLVVLFVE